MRRTFFWLAGVLILLCFPCLSQENRPSPIDLRGCVFGDDGTTPVEQVTVYARKLPDGEILKSLKSDRDGSFVIEGLERGIYALGVKTLRGNFNARELIGIGAQAGEYARMYMSLSPRSGSEGREHLPSLLPDSIGQVIVLAGNAAVVVGISDIDDAPREAGPFKTGRSP